MTGLVRSVVKQSGRDLSGDGCRGVKRWAECLVELSGSARKTVSQWILLQMVKNLQRRGDVRGSFPLSHFTDAEVASDLYDFIMILFFFWARKKAYICIFCLFQVPKPRTHSY